MQLFLKSNNKVIDAKEIKKSIWGAEVSDERVRTFIKRFRNKTSYNLVQNIKGEGYKLTINNL
jgi:DNA-binding response OmpR family regulator